MSPTPVLTPHPGGRAHPPTRRSTAHHPWSGSSPDWPADDVLDAGLDSFPASDPPSWSPLRVGAPDA